MTRYGYANGMFKDQALVQYDVLKASGMDFDGGIVVNQPWEDFLMLLESGDEVVVVAKSRLSMDPDECKGRQEILQLLDVNLVALAQGL